MTSFFSAFLQKISQDLRASYWFVPGSMALLALIAAIASETLDKYGINGWLPEVLRVADTSAARAVLSTIATASIGAAGVMFSMTIVAVSFASSNFGPRLIGNFMQDRGVQFSLGALLGTFVFSLTVLLGVRDGLDDGDYVPSLSLALALLLVLFSVTVLIYFVHHIPEIISLENLSARLGRKLLRAIDALPEAETLKTDANGFDGTTTDLILPQIGYIQALDVVRLRHLCDDRDWKLRLMKGPGDFVGPGKPVAQVACPSGLGDKDRLALQRCFAIGDGRTESQNPMFLAQQLMEIIARALSPGVNDPVSAINCLNWLHSALTRLAMRDHPNATIGSAEIMTPGAEISFVRTLRVAHADPRPYIAADPLVTRHALSLLADLRDSLPAGPRQSAVTDEIRNLVEAAKALSPQNAEVRHLSVEDPTKSSPAV